MTKANCKAKCRCVSELGIFKLLDYFSFTNLTNYGGWGREHSERKEERQTVVAFMGMATMMVHTPVNLFCTGDSSGKCWSSSTFWTIRDVLLLLVLTVRAQKQKQGLLGLA